MKILCVVGTRPEAIKMSPIINALKQEPWAITRVLATAQHRQLLDQILKGFKISPDIDLDLMSENQTLSELTSRLLFALDKVLREESPDLVLAQGDTTTVMSMALSCFYNRIPFGHIEAGLRTWDMSNPYPEEMNRVIASRLAKLHFAPTKMTKENLLKEGIKDSDIYITGNTVIDAVLSVKELDIAHNINLDKTKKLILLTTHRRENFGEGIDNIFKSILTILNSNPNVQVLYPVHPNPSVRDKAYEMLNRNPNIILTDPLDYIPFIKIMSQSYLILSDSGGIQEESTALGKPMLVLRDKTERPEAILSGNVKLVGTEHDRIVKETQNLLDNKEDYNKMINNTSPYGDGAAANKIVRIIKEFNKDKK